MAPEEVDIPILDYKGIKRVQAIVGTLLLYGLVVFNKVLVDLNTIGIQHAAATESTNEDIYHPLDYLATYPNNGIVYRARKMVFSHTQMLDSIMNPRAAAKLETTSSLRKINQSQDGMDPY